MSNSKDPSEEDRARRIQETLAAMGEGALANVLQVIGATAPSAAAPQSWGTVRPALGRTESAIRAALAHTFTIVEPNTASEGVQPDQITPAGEEETRALLANSLVIMIGGRRRLCLTDEARAGVLNAVHESPLYERLLRQGYDQDMRDFKTISDDEVRLPAAWLRSFLDGHHGDLAAAPATELRAAVEALERLQYLKFDDPPRPPRSDACRLLQLAELLEPLRLLIGSRGGWDGTPRRDRFVGRATELARLRGFVDQLGSQTAGEWGERLLTRGYKKVQRFFGSQDDRVFMIEARGGLGKSTLMAKFMLDHALHQQSSFPFAYLDFDRAVLQPREPRALLLEVSRQVSLQFPAQEKALQELNARLRDELAGRSRPLGDDHFNTFRTLVRDGICERSRPFLLVLDTMEVVQYDPAYVTGIISFLTSLKGTLQGSEFPELKIVAAGRANIPELRSQQAERASDQRLTLGALSTKEAREMAKRIGSELMGSQWQPKWADQLAGTETDPPERREPLTVRVAVELLRNSTPEQREALVQAIAKEGESANQYFVGRLYQRRVLNHVRDEDARRLAWPGLVFRRVTRDLIRDPLARLCGIDPSRADAVFAALANEVWMVDVQGDSLRHRPDLRARTLPLMRLNDEKKFMEVNSAAVHYFAERCEKDSAARAECIYHRLLGGEEPERVDADWQDDLSKYLLGAADDFDRDSPQGSYLMSRTATRLLPPQKVGRLPPRLALDHLARTGERLGAFDDTRINPVLVDLAGKLGELGVSSSHTHPARAVLLVKTGRWDVPAPFEGGEDAWAVHASFASRYKRARTVMEKIEGADGAHRGEQESPSVTEVPSFNETASPAPLRTAIQDLAYSRLTSISAARTIDSMLAAALNDARPLANPSDIAALRTAVVFGWKCSAPAARLWLESQTSSAWTHRIPSLSLAEARVLLQGGRQVRSLLRNELRDPFGDAPTTLWSDLLVLARNPSEQPMRISHPRMGPVIQGAVNALLAQGSEDALRVLRDFFAARDDDWIVPIAYAAARCVAAGDRTKLLAKRMRSHVEWAASRLVSGSVPEQSVFPRDALGILRTADEAADLLGVARIYEEASRNGEATEALRSLLIRYAVWRESIQLLLDEDDGDGLVLPKPAPVRHKDDIQKDRWGGTEARDGRRLEAVLVEAGPDDFLTNLIVRSTDGSELEGPVVFYLHDTFPRSKVTTRVIHERSWAVLEAVNSYGVFTVGAQVKNAAGKWTSLEYDLMSLKGLPKIFLSR